MLQYIIEPKALGTAYGIMTAMQNAGLAVFPEYDLLLLFIESIDELTNFIESLVPSKDTRTLLRNTPFHLSSSCSVL